MISTRHCRRPSSGMSNDSPPASSSPDASPQCRIAIAGGLARIAAKSYREQLSDLALLAPLDAWNTRIDLVGAVADIDSPKIRRNLKKRLAEVLAAGKEHFGLVEMTDGHWHIKDKPPLVRHLSRHELHAHKAFSSYAETLQEDRRVLLQRYHLRDIAFKVVGVGSVGTFCGIGLFISDDDAPLLL